MSKMDPDAQAFEQRKAEALLTESTCPICFARVLDGECIEADCHPLPERHADVRPLDLEDDGEYDDAPWDDGKD